jgi:ribosomal protein S18 acetylase RimI-like enzyme
VTEPIADVGLPAFPTASGLRARPYAGRADHPAMAALISECLRVGGFGEREEPAGLDAWLTDPRNMDPSRDIVLVETGAGALVACAIVRWLDRNTTGERSFETSCDVHPEYRRRGIGGALLAWQDARIAEIISGMTDLAGRPVIAAGYVSELDADGQALLRRTGFTEVRRAAEMHREDLADLPDPPIPDGIRIGSIDPTDQPMLRRVWAVTGEVFSGHWGDPEPDRSESAWRRFIDHPYVQPELWCVAFDGDEVIGHILNYVAPADDGAIIGWTEGIAVRGEWRRRGIARAMLAWSLRRVRDAGAVRAALGVDVSNPNQAPELYASMGFRTTTIELEYHRALSPAP